MNQGTVRKYKNKYRITSRRLPNWNYAGAGHYFITLVVQGRHCVFGHIANKKMILNPWGRIAYRQWFRSFAIREELYFREFILMPNHLHALVTLSEIRTYPTDYPEFPDPPIPPQMVGGVGGVDRVDPVDPVAPVAPVDPVDPVDRVDPLETHGRVSPHGNRGNHGNPVNPENPGNPENHGNPGNPENPGNPGNPENPENPENPAPKKLYRKPRSLSSFIAGYKSSVTTRINDLIDSNPDQRLFPELGKFNRHNKLWQPNYHDHIIRNQREWYRIVNYIRNNPANWSNHQQT